MQLSVPWRFGQKRPFTSIPRINWAHPLAYKLVFYGYDTGTGLTIDLVRGLRPTLLNSPHPSNRPTPLGSGSLFVNAGGSYTFPATNFVNNILTDGISSIASGWYLTALPSNTFAGVFGINDSGSTTQSTILLEQTNTADMQWSCNNTNATPIRGNTINAFHTFVGSGVSATSQKWYFDGALKQTNALTASVTTATALVCFNSNSSGASGGNTVPGWIYYGALWDRAITAGEALQLHLDPYCFLIYPEDEMFASLVGPAAAVVTSPTWGWEPESAQKYIFAQHRRGAGGSPR